MELSSLGLGTYLGNPDAAADAGYAEAARAFFEAGGNVFDTAANYRSGHSERALGRVLPHLPRETFFVSTRAGYLPMGDGVREESPRAWFDRVLHEPGILDPGEVVDGCHAMTPRYLAHQLEISLEALGLEKIDLFHLHNPEQQRPSLGPDRFREVIRRAFEACEGFVAEGKAGAYGCATWNGFRVTADSPENLSLAELLALAEEVGGRTHHFTWIQVPLNLALTEVYRAPTQVFHGQRMTLLAAAQLENIRLLAKPKLEPERLAELLA